MRLYFVSILQVRRSPLYPPIVEAPPPPYPPTRTRFQDYYSGYGQLHPSPLRPFRDEYYGEGEYEGCFPFLDSTIFGPRSLVVLVSFPSFGGRSQGCSRSFFCLLECVEINFGFYLEITL